MNFEEILNVASKNSLKNKPSASGLYNNILPPPKKLQKSAVKSDGIRKFLEKQKAEEAAKAAEAKQKKEQLLAIRSQNSKNNKKAKIMASRTKDNDFSRIKLTEDEVESKKKIELELQRKHLAGKVERMKARIELEEKEAMLPKKRKRKSKVDAALVTNDASQYEENTSQFKKDSKSSKNQDKQPVKKVPRPAPPPMSFHDLLKMAEVKQFEPVDIPLKKKEDDKLLTKKQRKLMIEEQERIRRQQERIRRDEGIPKPLNSSKTSNNIHKKVSKTSSDKPVVIHVEKCSSKSEVLSKNIKNSSDIKGTLIPKVSDRSKLSNANKLPKPSSSGSVKPNQPSSSQVAYTNHDREKSLKTARHVEKDGKQNNKSDSKSSVKRPPGQEKPNPKTTVVKISSETPQAPLFDTSAIMEEMEKRLREKLEKEMEEKLSKVLANRIPTPVSLPSVSNPQKSKTAPPNVSNPTDKNIKTVPHRSERPITSKPSNGNPKNGPHIGNQKVLLSNGSQKRLPERPPLKKPFHPNPYLDPPRRRLEPIRPQKAMLKRRIESDDEDEDDDDDLDGFIDDSIDNQNEENYSKYIKEIFQYDRSKYIDEDEDDIRETSFADQMKEETRSARLGFLEDLEEERKLREMEKKRKKKLNN